MQLPSGSKSFQRNAFLALPLVALAWLVAVPAVVTTSSFIAVVGLLAAFGWIAKTTYENGQPAGSLAQVLHDAERSATPKDPRAGR